MNIFKKLASKLGMKKLVIMIVSLGVVVIAGISSVVVLLLNKDNADTIQISYETNGGESISADVVDIGETHTLPTPVRAGYVFEGWYLTADYSGEPVTSVVADSNVTYYAKWTQVQTITLELNGGSLSESTLYLKAGENLYDFMQAYKPTKSGLTFGAWFKDGIELSATAKMPESDITLTAKYKVAYTIERYLENLNDDDYTKAEDIIGYEYVGTNFNAQIKETGFTAVSNGNTVATKVLSEKASENVFKLYFSRDTYHVNFNTNYPNEAQQNESVSVEAKYGVEVEMPVDLACEGYCLIGWSTTPSGEVEYAANYIENALYGKEGMDSEIAKFQPVRNTTLYAVWQKGYVDLFGGNDYIFVVESKAKVYLARGEVFFEGEYDEYNNSFYFMNYSENSEGTITMEGRLYANGKFAYKRSASSAALYDIESNTLVKTTTLQFGQYNDITYVIFDESTGKSSDSKGTFVIDENGDYVVTFTSGALSGKTRVFRVSQIPNEETGADENGFLVRKEEDIELGKLTSLGITSGFEIGKRQAYTIEFDGFGSAMFDTGSAVETYNYYKSENNVITLKDNNDREVLTVKIVNTPEYGNGYFFYEEALNRTLDLGNGKTIEMDGMYNVSYFDGQKMTNTYYTSKSSVFGGTIVTFEVAGETHKVLVTSTETEVPVEDGEEGETEVLVEYDAEEKLSTYAEYYYKSESSIYYAPMLVIDENEAGKATLYGYTSQEYLKVSDGTYIYSEETGLYVYTAENYYEAEGIYDQPYDLTTIQAFVFNLDTTSYAVNYWYSSTDKDGETSVYDKNYTGVDGSTLKLVGGFAWYTMADGTKVVGTYQKAEDVITITKAGAIKEYFYLKVTDVNTPYEVLEYAPYKAYMIGENGKYTDEKYIYFSGLGTATYKVVTYDDEGEETVEESYEGTFAYTNQDTNFGDKIYKFTAEGKEFEYIAIEGGNTQFISAYNGKYALDYVDVAGMLKIDGFGYKATYKSGAETFEGNYYLVEEESDVTVVLVCADNTYYFDLTNDGFTVKGEEYGTYVLVDNGYLNGIYFDLDGYGKLSVYKKELKDGSDTEYENVYIDENGTYEEVDGVYTFTYTDGDKPVIYVCMQGENYNSYGTFFISNDNDIVKVYVNESDWSILILDAYGNATKYNEKGQKENGSYVLVTETLLHFNNKDLDSGCIYEYDTEKKTATPIELTKRGYYTKDLKSLLFTEYGFVIVNGNTRNPYYYNVESGKIIMYKHDATATDANAYGFVTITDIEFPDDDEVFEGETYYKNSGYDISFERAESEISEYPLVFKNDEKTQKLYLLALDFTPSGAEEFRVNGDAKIRIVTTTGDDEKTEEQTVSCTVTRSVNEDGTVEMYATVNGYYRFNIKLTYFGVSDDEEVKSENTLKVTGACSVLPIYSYRYLQALYRLYAMGYGAYASSYKNTVGFITLNEDFLITGESEKKYVTGEFGADSEMYDINGEIVSFTEATYSLDKESNIYTVEFTAKDGYMYRLHFVVYRHSAFNAYGYYVLAFTRVQTLTVDSYVLETERIIATEDRNYEVGDLYTMKLTKDGEDVTLEKLVKAGDKVAYVSETDENGNKKYYWLTFTDDDNGAVEDDKNIVALYKSVALTEETAKVLYSSNGKLSVDISTEKNEVLWVQLVKAAYAATSSTYDETTSTYTVETAAGIKFFVKVVTENEETYVEITEE